MNLGGKVSFSKFLQIFKCTDEIGPGDLKLLSMISLNDVREIIEQLGGKTFNDGLYRVFQADEIQAVANVLKDSFMEFSDRLEPFGFDWLGRIFAANKNCLVDDRPQITMIEFGAGEAMQIPCSPIEFHESELIEFADDALSRPFFDQWRSKHLDPIGHKECVAYKVPLFLGGSDTLDNLEVSDRFIYWNLCGQLREQAMSLDDGQRLGKIKYE